MIFQGILQVGRVRVQTVREIPLVQMKIETEGSYDTSPSQLSRDEDGTDGESSMEEPSIADLLPPNNRS